MRRGYHCFNPRSRAGSDHVAPDAQTDYLRVSIHAPARGATSALGSCRLRLRRFNPRSRAGSDRRLTSAKSKSRSCFNPRSRAGSDVSSWSSPACHSRFQSTLPRGERRLPSGVLARFTEVSIHAPARGATTTTRRRGRRFPFQSTLPRGERQQIHRDLQRFAGFNPRSRAGSDDGPTAERVAPGLVSIHAPARGATTPVQVGSPARAGFNPRSRAGSDGPVRRVGVGRHLVSIHAPARGATIGATS